MNHSPCSMTSLRQLEANRLNALKSTGPKTAAGKEQSRRNALRHGFTAETVIEPFEAPEEYRDFEHAIVSEYLPQTPVAQELVHRLASLFWRLRRATSIETGLLRMQAEILCAFRSSRPKPTPRGGETPSPSPPLDPRGPTVGEDGLDDLARGGPGDLIPTEPLGASASRAVAVSFLRLANLENDIVDRLSRYEAALWRQLAQTLFTIQAIRRR
jgi:hypothetical protein